MAELLEVISSGGDPADLVILGMMWRFDRRLLALENRVKK